MEYLADLLKEKKQLSLFPNFFPHLDRLIDDEIARVRSSVFQCDFNLDSLKLPEPKGEVIQVTEKVYVPKKDHPDYNFVGRILGPRGMTAKQLEQETGCKIMIRGQGSMRDLSKEEQNRGKPNYEHLNDELHVLIQCEDTKERAAIKLANAVSQIKKLLVPPATQGIDELKRKQLMELAIINGTYRPSQQKYMLPMPTRIMPMASPFPRHQKTPNAMTSFSSLFGSPLPSPVESNESSTPSLPGLRDSGGDKCIKHDGLPGIYPISKNDQMLMSPNSKQQAFDFNLSLILNALNQQSFDPLNSPPLISKLSPWLANGSGLG